MENNDHQVLLERAVAAIRASLCTDISPEFLPAKLKISAAEANAIIADLAKMGVIDAGSSSSGDYAVRTDLKPAHPELQQANCGSTARQSSLNAPNTCPAVTAAAAPQNDRRPGPRRSPGHSKLSDTPTPSIDNESLRAKVKSDSRTNRRRAQIPGRGATTGATDNDVMPNKGEATIETFTQKADSVCDGVHLAGSHKVSIHQITEDPLNERKTFRNTEGLIDSVKAVGVVEPITVTPSGDENFMIVTGHRRFRAAKAAGFKEIEIVIRDPESEKIRRRKSVISNIQREALGPVELAEALQTLLDEDGTFTSHKQLAELLGKSQVWVSEMLKILKLPAAIQTTLRTSELDIPADSVVRIARLKDRSRQQELIENLLNGASSREVRAKIQERKKEERSKTRLSIAYQAKGGVGIRLDSEIDLTLDRQHEALLDVLGQVQQLMNPTEASKKAA